MNRSNFLGSGMALTGAGLLSSCSTQLAHPAIETESPQTLTLIRPNVLAASSEMSASLKGLNIEGYQEAGSNNLFWSQYAKTSAPTLILPNTIVTAPRRFLKPNLVINGGGNVYGYDWNFDDGSFGYGFGQTTVFPASGNKGGHAVFYDSSGTYPGPTFWQAGVACSSQVAGAVAIGFQLLKAILANAPTMGAKITGIGAKYVATGATLARAALFILEVFAVASVAQWLALGVLVFGLIACGISLAQCIGSRTSYRQGALRLA